MNDNSNNEWISRNPNLSRKRDRRSYDNNWDAYEARAGNNHFGRQRENGFSRRQQGLSADGIIVEGERVGVPHNGLHNSAPQHDAARNVGPSSSRIRIADYRGSAARIGVLPAKVPPPIAYHSTAPALNAPKLNNQSINPSFTSVLLQSLTNPPPITVTLPPDLRSTLNTEQCQVVESILSGHSTFFTGPAGSGKSHVLQSLLAANSLGIGNDGRPRKIVVTATTGVSACNIGGTTVHSFSGAGPSTASSVEMAKRVMGNEYAKQRWREVEILIIDEISMMAASFLDKLNFIAQRARNDRRPFGGVQLVVCGDFFQLPPIELAKDGFAFEAKCWPQVIKRCVLLRQVFRQQGDVTLMNILDEARIGELSAQSVQVLKRHGTLPSAACGHTSQDDNAKIIPTLLECRNKNVDQANEREMAKLKGETHIFHARDRAIADNYKAQLKQCQAPAVLELKVGAQVMLLKNIDLDKGLANGSRGVVVRFQPPTNESEVPTGFKKIDLPVVRFDSLKSSGEFLTGDDREFTILPEEWQNKMGDQTVSARVQIPLRLAWSISVHKSQGMTIPNLTVNLSGVFEYGQAYVALSRATELRLLTLRGFSEGAFRAHPLVKVPCVSSRNWK
ncbi:hypothetical protein ACHAWX_004240 [Stephanocyclus meneghinianus]